MWALVAGMLLGAVIMIVGVFFGAAISDHSRKNSLDVFNN